MTEPNEHLKQKIWLTQAKTTLSAHIPGLTWDAFAKLVGIEPRAMKSYRMPQTSADFRAMPKAVEILISESVKKHLEKATTPAQSVTRDDGQILMGALAALIVRQAKEAVINGRVINGVSMIPGSNFGLEDRDREAMALVSKYCLRNGQIDHGSEIHHLLAQCTRPFKEWLPIEEVQRLGLHDATFIDPKELIPTPEAEELAKNFGDIVQSLEESLFAKLKELLSRINRELANVYYTKIREFVVRHPVCRLDQIQEVGRGLSSVISMLVQQQFYEPVPESWATKGNQVEICAHCGNALEKTKFGKVCRTRACASLLPTLSNHLVAASDLVRATIGIRQYWIEPGFDEVRMFDALKDMGLEPTLYPDSDRTDISFKNVGIDLKSYVSPETLGFKLKRSIGGLTMYDQKWLVIPDWLINKTPGYIDRLMVAMDRPEVHCLSVTAALNKAKGYIHA